jgi:hypothetical protein
MYLACIVGMFALVIGCGWLLAVISPPEPPPTRLVHRLWASKSITRGSRR